MSDRVEAIQALLVEAEQAHGVYEATELNGVYDADWPRWYAAWAVDHGIGEHVGHTVATDALADLLASGFEDFRQSDSQAEPWSAYLARRIAQEL